MEHGISKIEKGQPVALLKSRVIERSLDAISKAVKVLRAVIYLRVSTQEQVQGKASIPDQLDVCMKAINARGWVFVQEYRDEGISGHLTEERHGLQSMLRDAREHKFDLIVLKDFDRLARNKDAAGVLRQELKSLGIQVFSVNSPIDPKLPGDYDPDDDDLGTMVESMSDLRADLERKQIIRRMKMGKMRNAQAGNIPNRAPYGYAIKRELVGSRIRREVIVNEEEAVRIKFIFNEYARGTGDRKIAIAMNDQGWRARQGGYWTISAVRYILANPTYTGKVWWGWRHALYSKTKEWRRRGKQGFIGPGTHTPLVDEKLFNIVQEIRNGRARGARGGVGRSRGLLTGIAKCIRCGSNVGYQKRYHARTKTNPKWKNTITFEYICCGYKYRGICSPRVMSAEKLESEVLNHIRNIYQHPKVQERIVYSPSGEEESDRGKEIARLQREISMEEIKIQRQQEAYERGIISIDEYQARLDKIREETGRCRMDRDRLASLSSLSAQRAGAVQKLVESLKDFDTAWGKMQLDEKKLILRSIIKEIRAGGNKVEIDFIL